MGKPGAGRRAFRIMVGVGLAGSLITMPSISQASAITGSSQAHPRLSPARTGLAPKVSTDYNGDGYADLAIGVYAETVAGHWRAGAVNVIYGSACQLQPDPTCGNPDDQFFTEDTAGLNTDGAEPYDLFGHTLAYGDFNHDGYDDLAVGAYGDSVGTIAAAGAVSIIYGSACGLQPDPTCGNPDDQWWTENSPGLNTDGAEAQDEFGHYLVAADFNGDGYADLAIGVSGEDVGTIVDAGAVSVLYGSATGLQADSPDDQWWTQDSPGVKDQAEQGDRVGESLGAGDFNGDGFGDLVISVFLEGLPGVIQAGAVNVIYGSACGLQADPTCGNPDDQFFTQGSDGVKDQAEKNDWFGRSPAAGDFNGDGFDDLALGAEKEDVGTAADAGSVNVIYGSACGLQPDPTCGNPDDQFFTQGSDGVKDQAESGDFLGRGTRAGDLNGDGYADLAVSAFREDLGTIDDAGSVNVIYGSACGLQPDPTCGNPDDQFWNQDSPGVQDQAESKDQLGKNLGPIEDFNGDGYGDLPIGVHLEDVGGVQNAGIAQVLYGSSGGLQATSPDDQKFAQGHGGVQDQAEKYDRFGWFS